MTTFDQLTIKSTIEGYKKKNLIVRRLLITLLKIF